MANKVKGANRVHQIMLYALSTCVWCRKTKKLLDTLDVEYEYLFVDLLDGEEEERAMDQVGRYNPGRTFPTMVIDGKRVIVGFKEPEIRKALS
ncbi:MAG: glutaredoxin family protein [Candidatus Edwardsbacteria bacterium]|jgi:glutaredoxin|nr:glutaredoxin family protein [Candidatus Edwardsbacteria bacterium]